VDAYAPTTRFSRLYNRLGQADRTRWRSSDATKNSVERYSSLPGRLRRDGRASDTTAPTVTITSPISGASVSGTVIVRADAWITPPWWACSSRGRVAAGRGRHERYRMRHLEHGNRAGRSHTVNGSRRTRGEHREPAAVAATCPRRPPPAATRVENTEPVHHLYVRFSRSTRIPDSPPTGSMAAGVEGGAWGPPRSTVRGSDPGDAHLYGTSVSGSGSSPVGWHRSSLCRRHVPPQSSTCMRRTEQVQTPVFTASNPDIGPAHDHRRIDGTEQPQRLGLRRGLDAFDVTPGFHGDRGTPREETAASTTSPAVGLRGYEKAWSGGDAPSLRHRWFTRARGHLHVQSAPR